MIFVDSNIPMYLVGASHPNKSKSRSLLEDAVRRGERLVTDVEVLQEILHRYVAIGRRDAIQPAFDALLRIADEVFAVEQRDVERAKEIVLGSTRLSARDAVHAALMQRHRVDRILTFDRGFDEISGLTRLV
jgi:uncharacterized protein